jgi:hypothetical protein
MIVKIRYDFLFLTFAKAGQNQLPPFQAITLRPKPTSSISSHSGQAVMAESTKATKGSHFTNRANNISRQIEATKGSHVSFFLQYS